MGSESAQCHPCKTQNTGENPKAVNSHGLTLGALAAKTNPLWVGICE